MHHQCRCGDLGQGGASVKGSGCCRPDGGCRRARPTVAAGARTNARTPHCPNSTGKTDPRMYCGSLPQVAIIRSTTSANRLSRLSDPSGSRWTAIMPERPGWVLSNTSRSTRSGCSAANSWAISPPSDAPSSAGRSSPAASMTARMSVVRCSRVGGVVELVRQPHPPLVEHGDADVTGDVLEESPVELMLPEDLDVRHQRRYGQNVGT